MSNIYLCKYLSQDNRCTIVDVAYIKSVFLYGIFFGGEGTPDGAQILTLEAQHVVSGCNQE